MIPLPVFAAVHVLPDPPLPFWTFLISTVIKISAWIQGRLGPNRVGGTLGLLQPAADGVKNIMKEETLPAHVNKPLFMLAPMLAFIPARLAWAVIPFGAPWDSRWGRISMVVADLPVGFLFTLAMAVLTGIITGLAPTLQLARPHVSDTLKDGGRGSTDVIDPWPT